MADIDEATDRVIAGPAKKAGLFRKRSAVLLPIMKADIPLSVSF